MKNSSLDQAVKAYYAGQDLEASKLAQLTAQASLADEGKYAGWHWGRVVAAVATVVLGFSLWWAALPGPEHETWELRAAREIALNHRKQLGEEFVATDFDGLRRQMHKLDFALIEPASVRALGLRVTGARYCSIQGNLAAQIHLSDGKGRRYTLYQAHVSNEAGEEFAERRIVENVDIRQWRDGTLFFGLATAIDSGQ